ncbi:MmyB family transcriptional regulator [Streptomyces milbemycinicus]|uniref:MmyB-like transcription regulator ligand binding domain-containing protein n=1 Tax=Streptomyces milbemycinicus TaxID=476552 RepID=A0ABW8LMN2_9ACTN
MDRSAAPVIGRSRRWAAAAARPETRGTPPDRSPGVPRRGVLDKTHGGYRLYHPRIGRFSLDFRALRLPEEPGQLLVAYIVEPGSALDAALRRLEGATDE